MKNKHNSKISITLDMHQLRLVINALHHYRESCSSLVLNNKNLKSIIDTNNIEKVRMIFSDLYYDLEII